MTAQPQGSLALRTSDSRASTAPAPPPLHIPTQLPRGDVAPKGLVALSQYAHSSSCSFSPGWLAASVLYHVCGFITMPDTYQATVSFCLWVCVSKQIPSS